MIKFEFFCSSEIEFPHYPINFRIEFDEMTIFYLDMSFKGKLAHLIRGICALILCQSLPSLGFRHLFYKFFYLILDSRLPNWLLGTAILCEMSIYFYLFYYYKISMNCDSVVSIMFLCNLFKTIF